jgi:5-formaminoimidazole-4-carboxamide-1-beta-D-ribofuranosyl 5'-monophosphate synthetase
LKKGKSTRLQHCGAAGQSHSALHRFWASCRWSFSTAICCSENSDTFRRSFCSENTNWTETEW